MSSIRAPHSVRCERAPLCDVQNERSAPQQTSSGVKVCEVRSDQKENLSENTPGTNITFTSFTCAGGEVEVSDRSDLCDESVLIARDSPRTLNNTTVTCEDAEGEHEDHPYSRHSTDRKQEDQKASGDQTPSHTNSTDVTFESFTCPGGEVEIPGDESVVHDDSIVARDPDSDNPTQSFEDEVSEEHTELPSRHFDHVYSNTQMSELRSGKMEEEDGDGGSVNYASISISKNATDVTFKSFTCPGGEVEIAEESLVKNESLAQDESLVTKDSEVQNLQSETCDEHTELPSLHCDHPYVTDSFPVRVNHSSVRSTVFHANSPVGVITINDSSNTLNGSTAAERRDDVTFRFSGAEVEIENTCRTLDMSMLTKSLNMDDQAKSSPNSELREHGGESLITSEKDYRTYCPVVKNDPELMVSENEAHLSVHVSNPGVLESSESTVRIEGSERMKSEMMVLESSSDPTEVHNVESVQQRDLHQQTSARLEENVLTDENTRLRCDVEVFSDQDGEIRSHSQPGVDRIPKNVGTAETQTVQNHNIISQNANAWTHADLEILRSESVDLEAQMKMWSHIVLSEPSTPKHSALGHLWIPESPIPPPQLHSTVLTAPLTPKPVSDHELQSEKVVKDFSAVGKEPLQEQLRKMGELLIAASGKISAPAAVTPVQQHSACVWTTPTSQQERSTNTSAIMEERKEIHVSDACTSTDSLLWSVSRGNLECLTRSELEQRMISTLIMVEVLSQQLTSTQNLRGRTEPSPSSLRDRHIQTERTVLSQTGPYRELYVSALERIRTLEIDQETFHNLHQAMQLMSKTLRSIKSETEEVLCSLKELEGIVTDDQEIQSQQLGQMKALSARCMDTLRKMEQKNRVCVKDRDDMKQQKEEALEEKSTVLRVLEQLRVLHTTQVSDLQRNLGSHEELTDALTHTYPQLVELSRMHMDSVTEANTLLSETLEDHTHLSAELHKAQQLLQRTYPLLHQLQHKASGALLQSRKHQEERDQAVEDRQQMEQQLYDTHSSLQEAHQQIADLNTQITIMSSEMAVLREQLTEVEDERSQFERKTTELSAVVSSTLASYAFLEQTLASETSKLQSLLHNTREATERADSPQAALSVCERRVEELEQTRYRERESILNSV
ncbi:hypothetical protein AMELA_G00056210 [Ameiurus melas]|uniref:Sperm-associated antigen 5 n=1 Tax=Ameiurus melas TaxID=219545 RepID=A0A7J6B8U4_AMEME|nr:hypothetical protein AMELA_G00056210 [Ameiurus melas]